MAQYVAFDPNVQVKGAAILATLHGMGREIYAPIAEKFGLAQVEADGWYPQQSWLDLLKALDTKSGGSLDLVAVGMNIPNTADWPTGITTLEQALYSIDQAYHFNHRYGEIGHYRAERISDQQVDVICDNPYPCYFDYGIVFSTARKFKPAGVGFTVVHDKQTCRQRGDDACIYHVQWQPE
jgi:hypothetical protein